MLPLQTLTIVDRRKFLAGALALVSAGILPRDVFALAAPHKLTHGTFEVTVASDGGLTLPVSILAPDAPPEELKKLLADAGITASEVQVACNPVIVKSGNDIILFDTGGPLQPSSGKLLESVAAAGFDPAGITKVVFTHAHPDHIWGTLGAGDKLNFPKATYYIGEAEWNFWMGKDILTQMPKEMHPFVIGAQKHINGVKDLLTMVKPGTEIVTGLVAVDTSGHTPGHLSFELAGADGLIIVGDAIASPAVHFVRPDWRFGFDAVPELAITNRKALLDRAATNKIKLLGYHWPYPGVGHAEKKDAGYHFVPAT